MSLTTVEQFVTGLGGRRRPRLPYWNASDDSPTLNHATFEIPLPDGYVNVEAAEMKEGVTWPDYPCAGDSYRDKFAATRFVRREPCTNCKNSLNLISVTNGFVPISEENLILFLGEFAK